MRLTFRHSLLLPLSLLAACNGSEPGLGAWVGTTDSLGDTIIVTTVSGGTWALPEPIRIDSVQPLWNGGDLRPRALMAVGDDGTIYVAERTQLDVLGPDGSVRPAIGRAGDGPGEFRNIAGVYASGDSVLVWDQGSLRFTLFDRTGRTLASHQVVPPQSLQGAQSLPLFPGPAGIVMAWNRGMVAPDVPPDSFAVMVGSVTSDSTHWRPLAYLRDIQWAHLGGMLGPKYVFGEKPIVAFGPGGSFAVTQGVEYRVDLGVASTSRVVRIVRRWDPVPVHDGIAVVPEDVVQQLPQRMRQAIPELVAGGVYGNVRNSISELRLDDARRLWVRVETAADTLNPMLSYWYPEGRARRYQWDLYGEDGKRLGAIELPSRFTPAAFQEGVVYGIYEEEGGNNAVAKVELPPAAR